MRARMCIIHIHYILYYIYGESSRCFHIPQLAALSRDIFALLYYYMVVERRCVSVAGRKKLTWDNCSAASEHNA